MAISAVIALAGCGGSDDDSTSTEGNSSSASVEETSMTKAQYVKEAQEICASETEKMLGVVRKAISNGNTVEAKVVLPPLESMVDRLTALGAPKGEAKQVEEFLGALEADLEETQGLDEATTDELALEFESSGDVARKAEIPACALG